MSHQSTSSASNGKGSSARGRERGGDEQENMERGKDESNHITYLTVPSLSSSRRPSTADVVIEKLQVEKVEGGGITISGVALAANCHITLMIFGVFFILAGIVLSYVGFAFTPDDPLEEGPIIARSSGASVKKEKSSKTHRQMQVIGPIFIVGGIVMFFLGISLFAISSKISRDEKERRLLMSALQLCQLENSFNQARVETNSSPVHTISAPSQNQDVPVLSLRRGSWWMEPTPVEYPLVPAENIPGSDCPPSYSRSESVRSPSPLMESSIAWSQQQPPNDKNSLHHSTAPSQQQQQKQLHQQHQQQQQLQQQLTTKRLPSAALSSFYGRREGTTDIATFPVENYHPGNSYPLRVQSVQKNMNGEEDESSVNLHEGRSKRGSGDGEQSEKPSTTASVPLITVSPVIDGEKVDSSSSSSPKVTVSPVDNSTTVAVVQPVSTNFPLSRNGIAIPRHSRHCNSSKPEG